MIWQGATAIADFAQVVLIVRVLGIQEYGRFAIIVALVTLVGGFFSLRVGYAATSFGADALTSNPSIAAGIFQLTFLIDLFTSLAGFALIAGIAPLVGPSVTGGAEDGLLVLAALGLIASSPATTFMAVLRLLDRFKLIAICWAAIETLRLVLVLVSLLLFRNLVGVLVALLFGKLANGLMSAWMATRVFHRTAPGVRLWRFAIRRIPRDTKRQMLKMIMHTNFVGYGRLGQVQLPTLLLGSLVGATETGIYKLGLAAASLVGRVADPASAALLTRFSRLWANHDLVNIRRLIRQTSMLAIPTVTFALGVLVALREPVLRFMGAKGEIGTAATVLVIAGVAQGLYGAFFWNKTLLFAAKHASAISIAVCAAAAVQTIIVLVTARSEGAVGAAIALLVSEAIVYIGLTWIALRVLRQEEERVYAVGEGL